MRWSTLCVALISSLPDTILLPLRPCKCFHSISTLKVVPEKQKWSTMSVIALHHLYAKCKEVSLYEQLDVHGKWAVMWLQFTAIQLDSNSASCTLFCPLNSQYFSQYIIPTIHPWCITIFCCRMLFNRNTTFEWAYCALHVPNTLLIFKNSIPLLNPHP